MELQIAMVILVLTGAGVGFASGLLGIGGSTIMVPVTFFVLTALGIPGQIAIKLAFGTNLLVVFTTALSGMNAHRRKDMVWWRPGIIMGISGAFGAATGAVFTVKFMNETILRQIFGLIVAIAAFRMMVSKLPDNPDSGTMPESELWMLLPLGFVTGIVGGMLGIGGGIIIVPVLTLLLKFDMHHAIGTSLLVMTFMSIAGAFSYSVTGLSVAGLPPFSVGYVNFAIWGCLMLPAVLTAYIGATAAHRLPATYLRYIFIALMAYIAFKMIV